MAVAVLSNVCGMPANVANKGHEKSLVFISLILSEYALFHGLGKP